MNDNPIFIAGWEELREVKDSENYTIEFEEGNGWILDKKTKETKHYLSTHTFYGGTYKYSTKILQECGFNVELANWDETRG